MPPTEDKSSQGANEMNTPGATRRHSVEIVDQSVRGPEGKMGKLGNVHVHASAWVGVVAVAGLLALLAVGPITAVSARPKPARPTFRGLNKRRANDLATATPIKHLVVVFQENRSFDGISGRIHAP